ncbi:Uncharacterised protein [Vibrio cholerae]|nr:Uncharacterised protein [Vibrio cholerae]
MGECAGAASQIRNCLYSLRGYLSMGRRFVITTELGSTFDA